MPQDGRRSLTTDDHFEMFFSCSFQFFLVKVPTLFRKCSFIYRLVLRPGLIAVVVDAVVVVAAVVRVMKVLVP